MSTSRPPEIPRNHPLALLLERSQKANQLPSCKGCKYASCAEWVEKAPELSQYDCLSGSTRGKDGNGITLYHDADHFCAAWEPRS